MSIILSVFVAFVRKTRDRNSLSILVLTISADQKLVNTIACIFQKASTKNLYHWKWRALLETTSRRLITIFTVKTKTTKGEMKSRTMHEIVGEKFKRIHDDLSKTHDCTTKIFGRDTFIFWLKTKFYFWH